MICNAVLTALRRALMKRFHCETRTVLQQWLEKPNKLGSNVEAHSERRSAYHWTYRTDQPFKSFKPILLSASQLDPMLSQVLCLPQENVFFLKPFERKRSSLFQAFRLPKFMRCRSKSVCCGMSPFQKPIKINCSQVLIHKLRFIS